MNFLKLIFGYLWIVLRTLLYGWVVALWGVLKLIWQQCQIATAKKHLPGRQGKASPKQCVTISDPAMKRPDPLIYDQYFLMALGYAVTWDNPDIWIELNNVSVSPDQLSPNTTYMVFAQIWNGSSDAPVVGLPVTFSYLTFGAGIQSHFIGSTTRNLGVKGDPPAIALMSWTTPSAPGHYCLQVSFSWFDDINPYNNLGQENTQVGVSHSPVTFEFELANKKRSPRSFQFETDVYAIPPLPPCRERVDTLRSNPPQSLPTLATSVKVPRQHDRRNYPLPAGWSVSFSPSNPQLAPGDQITVTITVTPAAGFVGRQPLNVHVFSESTLAGGMTFYIEGT